MIFRLSEKLSTQVKVVSLAGLPLDDNPYADWSARIFSVARTKHLILTNTKSLYSTVTYAKGINSENEFVGRALGSIRKFLDDDGQQLVYDRFIAPASSSVRCGWPGAGVGQIVFRHKRRKAAYMVVFLGIVVLHLAGWIWCYRNGWLP